MKWAGEMQSEMRREMQSEMHRDMQSEMRREMQSEMHARERCMHDEHTEHEPIRCRPHGNEMAGTQKCKGVDVCMLHPMRINTRCLKWREIRVEIPSQVGRNGIERSAPRGGRRLLLKLWHLGN